MYIVHRCFKSVKWRVNGALYNFCCYIASPSLKEFWKTEIPFQSLNSASFTGFSLKRKSVAFTSPTLASSMRTPSVCVCMSYILVIVLLLFYLVVYFKIASVPVLVALNLAIITY